MAIVTFRLPEVKATAEKRPSQCPHKGKVRVAGVAGFYARVKGKEKSLRGILDMGDGQPVELARWKRPTQRG